MFLPQSFLAPGVGPQKSCRGKRFHDFAFQLASLNLSSNLLSTLVLGPIPYSRISPNNTSLGDGMYHAQVFPSGDGMLAGKGKRKCINLPLQVLNKADVQDVLQDEESNDINQKVILITPYRKGLWQTYS
jgi:hypothetical protein